MLGEIFKCSDCEFLFSSGWSHHAGGQHLLCRTCGAEFIAKDGASVWGPEAGETLTIYCNVYRKKTKSYETVKTDIRVIATGEHPKDAKAGCIYRLTSALQSVECPVCDERGAVVERLADDSPCPKCNTGRISHEGECTY